MKRSSNEAIEQSQSVEQAPQPAHEQPTQTAKSKNYYDRLFKTLKLAELILRLLLSLQQLGILPKPMIHPPAPIVFPNPPQVSELAGDSFELKANSDQEGVTEKLSKGDSEHSNAADMIR